MKDRSVLLRRAVVGALALMTVPAFGQQATEQQQDTRTIDTIIVTAQKREQSLQDVPIVVTAVSEQLLQDTGVKDIKDLTILTPGLLVTSTSNESVTTARIRGIGTVGDNAGLESSVGVVIDGVYRPRNGVGFGDLGELERIEVLKGPQGTLFGKNTSAGVINVVTKRPAFDFGANVELTAGDYGAMEGAASVTGPFSDKVAGRLYIASRERDGFLDIVRGPGPRTEDEDVDRKFKTARGQLLFQPSEALDIRLTADYTDRDENCCAAPQVVLSPTPGVVQLLTTLVPNSLRNPPDPFDRVAYSNRSTKQEVEDKGASAEINWDLEALGGATLTSITAWRNWETINGQDADFTTVDILYRNPDGNFGNQFEQLSQEFRLAGESEKLSWLVGVFYADEDLESHDTLIIGNDFFNYFNGLLRGALSAIPAPLQPLLYPGGGATQDVYEQNSKSWALFTNNSIRFTDALELTLGVRYTDESKDLDSDYSNLHGGVGCATLRNIPAFVNNPAAATIFGIGCSVTYADPIFNDVAFSQSRDEQEWSGTAKIAYRFTDDVMSYLSYAKGYKGGGFNLYRERTGNFLLNPNPNNPAAPAVDRDTSFEEETVDSYELGVKTQWADNSLLVNGAVFYQDYTDFQLNTFTGLQFVVTSLPQVVSQGVDVDVVWYTPLEQLSFQGGVTYADTTIEEYGSALQFFRPEREDDQLSFAPEWSGSLSATYEQPIGNNLLFRGNVGARYTSEYNTGSNLDPRKIQDAMTLVNLRLGFGAADEKWMVELWSLNVTDEDYYQVLFDATLQGSSAGGTASTSTINGFLGAPRTYGVTARFKF
ncbi:TonB-dependent receptor [Steroidobacter agaridevorans]|uniref:TonB-dependent receptor n=1 Tax=Steroidobacter agaridevorans TaxID=2695856 RepID=A0A829YMM2_9GAMM|nr:TonB-dependent receptor [Steroidobacter agaridevorans]GFE84704.1 TonB-dependent receptor [Steroidobacter agaridevorans]